MTDQTLTLADSLDMTAAGPLHKELLGRRGQPVSLDASLSVYSAGWSPKSVSMYAYARRPCFPARRICSRL